MPINPPIDSISYYRMHYIGGKKRIAKHIADYINLTANKAGLISIPNYYEPFCGMCSVGRLVYADNKYFSDIFEPVITFWNAIRDGWLPDENLSTEQYHNLRLKMDYNNPMTAVAGFGCSFGAKWFGGYARSKRGEDYIGEVNIYVRHTRNFAQEAKSFAQEAKSFAQEAKSFAQEAYINIKPKNSYIYLDPPYFDTTRLPHLINTFNYKEFYHHCEQLKADNNMVFISEYSMPSDRFECVLEMPIKSTFSAQAVKGLKRIEKLFIVK